MSRNTRPGPAFLPGGVLKKAERVASERNVSAVARSPRGFMTALKRDEIDPEWLARRAAFIKRHMAQVEKRGEPLWKDGEPTRRHLALAMWAYSPTPGKFAEWSRRKGSKKGSR